MILGDIETMSAAVDNDIKEMCLKFIEQAYILNQSIGYLNISEEPDIDGKYVVDYKLYKSGDVNNPLNYINIRYMYRNIKSLTNDYFRWGVVESSFDIYNCRYLQSLEGAPHTVLSRFVIGDCYSIESLEGAPKIVYGACTIGYCPELRSLKGLPEKIMGDLDISTSIPAYFTEEDVRAICDLKGTFKSMSW